MNKANPRRCKTGNKISMKNMKNTFRLFLLFVFCFFSLNIKAYETIGYLKYNLSLTASDTTACVIGYSNSQKSMVIPDKVTYNGCQYKVTAIADEAFRSCGMEEITIGKLSLFVRGRFR